MPFQIYIMAARSEKISTKNERKSDVHPLKHLSTMSSMTWLKSKNVDEVLKNDNHMFIHDMITDYIRSFVCI